MVEKIKEVTNKELLEMVMSLAETVEEIQQILLDIRDKI